GRHLGEGAADAEVLDVAELGGVEAGVADPAVVIKLDGDPGVPPLCGSSGQSRCAGSRVTVHGRGKGHPSPRPPERQGGFRSKHLGRCLLGCLVPPSPCPSLAPCLSSTS